MFIRNLKQKNNIIEKLNLGCVRKVYNLVLNDRKKAYEEYKSTGIKYSY
ncbi:helix-turn-helix domain-containing protein [Fusobacterium periodonticum]